MQSHSRLALLLSTAAIKWLIIALSFLVAVAAFYSPPSMGYRPRQITVEPRFTLQPVPGSAEQPVPTSTNGSSGLMRLPQHADANSVAFHGKASGPNTGSSTYAVGVTGIRG